MNYFENIKKTFKDFIYSLINFKVNKANEQIIEIYEDMNRENALNLYQQIYIGSTEQIEDIVQSLDGLDKNSFYKRRMGDAQRVHNTLAGDMIDTLNNIVMNDFISFDTDEENKELLEKIVYENDIEDTLEKIIRQVLINGDGAFTINYNEKTKLPNIRFYKSNEIEIINEYQKFKELIIKHRKEIRGKTYYIFEKYGFGYIKYIATDDNGKEYDRNYFIEHIDETFPEEDDYFDENICLGIPIQFFSSMKYQDRGKSIYEGKLGVIFALDEITSTYADEISLNKTKQGINSELFPKGRDGQFLQRPPVQNRFIMFKRDTMNDTTGQDYFNIQSNLNSVEWETAMLNYMQILMQGILSPSSMGLDIKNINESGVSQKEKEKQTRFTINKIEKGLKLTYSNLLKMCILSYKYLNNERYNSDEINVNMSFNQFGSSDWGQQAEEIGKAKTYGVISTYTAVKKLNKDWTEEEIQEEVERINNEKGINIEDPFEKYTENIEDEIINEEEDKEIIEEESEEE